MECKQNSIPFVSNAQSVRKATCFYFFPRFFTILYLISFSVWKESAKLDQNNKRVWENTLSRLRNRWEVDLSKKVENYLCPQKNNMKTETGEKKL